MKRKWMAIVATVWLLTPSTGQLPGGQRLRTWTLQNKGTEPLWMFKVGDQVYYSDRARAGAMEVMPHAELSTFGCVNAEGAIVPCFESPTEGVVPPTGYPRD